MLTDKFKPGEIVRYKAGSSLEYGTVLTKEQAIRGFQDIYGVFAGELYYDAFGKNSVKRGIPGLYIKQHFNGTVTHILETEVISPLTKRRLPDWF